MAGNDNSCTSAVNKILPKGAKFYAILALLFFVASFAFIFAAFFASHLEVPAEMNQRMSIFQLEADLTELKAPAEPVPTDLIGNPQTEEVAIRYDFNLDGTKPEPEPSMTKTQLEEAIERRTIERGVFAGAGALSGLGAIGLGIKSYRKFQDDNNPHGTESFFHYRYMPGWLVVCLYVAMLALMVTSAFIPHYIGGWVAFLGPLSLMIGTTCVLGIKFKQHLNDPAMIIKGTGAGAASAQNSPAAPADTDAVEGPASPLPASQAAAEVPSPARSQRTRAHSFPAGSRTSPQPRARSKSDPTEKMSCTAPASPTSSHRERPGPPPARPTTPKPGPPPAPKPAAATQVNPTGIEGGNRIRRRLAREPICKLMNQIEDH